LIPVVLLVWGYIGYSIFNYGETEEEIAPIKVGTIISDESNSQRKKVLLLNYKDPFLKGNLYKKSKSVNAVSNKAPIKKVEVPIDWGQVTYNGFIHNNKNQKKVALLNINGRQVLAKVGEQINELIIKSIRQDSILIQKTNASKWFTKFKN